MFIVINRNTEIVSDIHTAPVDWAVRNLRRDIRKACAGSEAGGARIRLEKGNTKKKPSALLRVKVSWLSGLRMIWGLYTEFMRSAGTFWEYKTSGSGMTKE